MLRNRILILLGACLLATSAAWADDVGYIDCSSHSEGTQVFGKPRKTPEVVAALPCGERFMILVYGFYFSRIETKTGQVGYIYSNLITVDTGGASVHQPAPAPQVQQPPAPRVVQQVPSLEMATEKTKIPPTPPIDAEPAPTTPQPEPAAAQVPPASAQPPATTAPVAASPEVASPAASSPAPAGGAPETAAPSSQPNAAATPQPEPAAAPPQPDAVQTPAPQTTAAASSPAETTAVTAQPAPNAPTQSDAAPAASQPQPVAEQPASVPAPEAAASTTTSSAPSGYAPEPSAAAAPQPQPASAQPEPAAAQPQPEPAQPAPPPIKPGDKIETWEKPRPGVRTAPLIELYGGFAFARLGSASSGANLVGGIGSFGWNPKPWLQVVADTSYSYQSSGTTKNVLYGNHYGPRFFHRVRSRWGLTPFVEGLVGGSDEKTTVSGSGGYTASTGATLSYKLGGGLDMHPSRHWDVRLFDVDYYRTSFGGGTPQNNYWVSTGVVLRLFGGGAE